MELNWTTFLLETVNFLVLVWILKRFLYRPVLDVIARRRAEIERRLEEAETRHAEAAALEQQYEGRLADWEQERRQARESLARELEEERTRRLEAMDQALHEEEQKRRAAEEHRRAETVREAETAAIAQGALFATRLLEGGSGPETERHLAGLLIDELSELPPERLAALRNSHGERAGEILVESAYTLPGDERGRLESVLAPLAAPGTPVRFTLDSALLAGLQVTVGAWVIAANLRDELRGFAELFENE
jgi:F-type H+-transporting ATPase subunit b